MKINQINSISTDNQYRNNIKTSKRNISQPSFHGIFNSRNSKNMIKTTLDSDILIYTPAELTKLKENVTREVVEMFNQPATPGLVKRLDKILHSAFIDYQTPYFNQGQINLADHITLFKNSIGNELYRQFLLTSLAETIPMEVLDKNRKEKLTYTNQALYYILNTYSKMDEKTPMAEQVRKMVKRLADSNILIKNQNYLCARSIRSNQPLMAKTYVEALGLTPESKIEIMSDRYISKSYLAFLQERLEFPPLINDTSKEDLHFFIINPDKRDEINEKFKDTPYKQFLYKTENMSLYNLAGLSENKDIRENTFDIINWIKNNRNRYIRSSKMYIDQDKTLFTTLSTAKYYHPELKSLEYLEKYLMSYKNIFSLPELFDEFPDSYIENEKLLEEIPKRIIALKQENSLDASKRIQVLSDFYMYVGDAISVPEETLKNTLKSL